MLNKLKGWKTHIIVALGVLILLVQWLTGDLSFVQFVTSDNFLTLLELLGLSGLRIGLKSEAAKILK